MVEQSDHLKSAIGRRFSAPGPKRILALDGGGTRGIVSLALLQRIEDTLRGRLGRGDDFVLSDYFDLIGGTSVGSMIATLLAAGNKVAYVRQLFESWAPRIFEAGGFGFFSPMYDARVLRGLVQTEVLDWPLKSDRLKTGLCIVAKRVDIGSVWPIVNNPAGPYFLARSDGGNGPMRLGNGDYRLLDLIRASTAAPRYFSPTEIRIFEGVDSFGDPTSGRFVDGAVSPHNSPALQLFMMAGMSGYNFGGGPLEPKGERRAWPLGASNLLVVSVGTGSYDVMVERSGIALREAADALQGMIADGQELGLALLQWMSIPQRSWPIDRVVGDLRHDLLGDGAGLKQPLLSFQRYDVRLEEQWLADSGNCGKAVDRLELERLRDFTNVDAIGPLGEIAGIAASKQVSAEHFPDAFDDIWMDGAAHPEA